MQDKQPVRLKLPRELGPECLRETWSVEIHPQKSRPLVFWDTFEWGLWFGEHLLFSSDNVYHLCSRGSRGKGWIGEALCEEPTAARRRFWNDFETEPMRTRLEGMLGLRALAPVAEGRWRLTRCDLRNEAGKIVCRLEWASLFPGKRGQEELLRSCRVIPLQGYDAQAAAVLEQLTRRGATTTVDDPLQVLLAHADHTPRKYTLRPPFGLELDTPAREAAGMIVRAMLRIAASNVPGILNDLDTEFLHDYRICLRKIRSVLSLVKDAYPARETSRMRRIIGDLARQTNRLRDLDVYLLARDEYHGLLPAVLHPSLDGMFEDFATQRAREARRIASKMPGTANRRLFRELEVYYSAETAHKPSPAADLPVGPLVFRRIYQRYRKIRRIAAEFGANTPDEKVHRLRIECKKLRYLLEFFGELYPKGEGAVLLRSLRRLQDRLGEFNDASVQQRALMSYFEQKKSGTKVALGVGGLVSVLHDRQQQTRDLIHQALETFCATATAATFKQIFKRPASVHARNAKGGPR